MKIMVFLLVIMVAYMAFFRNNNQDNTKAAIITYSAERTNEQDKILVELQMLKDPHISEFVNDWRNYAPQPSPEQLSELRIIQQNIKNDKSVAEKYTLAWHNENSLCGQVPESFTKIECTPGL